ncbi:MAG: hypothetical protein P8M11_15805 [Planctomycetota bacterium]|nr:hypothetical protein [Planctomycetota bacterium]MDG1986018.1 hypothetical protein [Planctomycetota bacterium]
MSGALLVLRAEFMRMLASRAAWVGAVMILAVPALRIWAASFAERAKAIEAMGSGQSLTGLSEGTGWAMLVSGWRAGLMLATALLLVQGARSIAGDRETGVLRLAVTRSASRAGAVAGRALLGPILTVGMVALAGVAAYLATSVAGGDFGDLVQDDYPIFSADEVLIELRRALVVCSLGLMAVHAFGLLVSSLARGPVLALAGSLATLLVWDVFKDDFGAASWWVFASHAPTFADGSAMFEMVKFAGGYSDAGLPPAVHNMGLVLAPVEALAFVLLAALAVRRRPI